MAAPKKPSTHEARVGKKRKAQAAAEQAGTLQELRLKVWQCVERVDIILQDESADPLHTLKAAHALVQSAGAYAKLVETGELEKRLEALEEAHRKRESNFHRAA